MGDAGAQTQADRVFETLRTEILACRIRPGGKIKISDLAGTLQVSPEVTVLIPAVATS